MLLGQGDILVPGGTGSQTNNASGVSATAGEFTPPPAPTIPQTAAESLPTGADEAGLWGELGGSSASAGGLGGGGLEMEPVIAASATAEFIAWADASSGSFQIDVAEHTAGAWSTLGNSTGAQGISAFDWIGAEAECRDRLRRRADRRVDRPLVRRQQHQGRILRPEHE